MASAYFTGTVAKIALARRRAKALPLDLEIVSDSENLLARRFLEEVAKQAADSLQIQRDDIEVYYED